MSNCLDDILKARREDCKPFAFICSTEEKCSILQNKLYQKEKKQHGIVAICRNTSNIFDNLTVLENVFIHSSPLLRSKRMEQRNRYIEIAEKLSIHISPESKAAALSKEERYIIELLRNYFQGNKMMILGSISAVLGLGSFECFLRVLEFFQQEKITVLIISTRWEDTIQICDQIAVESGISKDCYSMLQVRDIRRDPRILFYALADYEEENIPDRSIETLNMLLDRAVSQNANKELDHYIADTLSIVKDRLNAVDASIYFTNGRYSVSGKNGNYALSNSFIQMMVEKMEKISFFTRSKYNYEDIFIQVPDNIHLVICHPIYTIPEKIGMLVLLFDKNILCSDEQILTIQMCCNLLGNIIGSAYIASKDVFIEESNHRVKNNLQTIISLLFIQKQIYHSPEYAGNIAVRQIDSFIENMVKRIKLIADMHDFVAKNHKDSLVVSSEEILRTVVSNYANCKNQIKVDAEYILLPHETASIVVMILNELICNSVIHAFKDVNQVDRQIHVCFKKENDDVLIVVSDNGCGLADVPKIQNTNSLGMKIITSLSRKLRADLKFENINGTKVSLKFKK